MTAKFQLFHKKQQNRKHYKTECEEDETRSPQRLVAETGGIGSGRVCAPLMTPKVNTHATVQGSSSKSEDMAKGQD